MRRDALLRVQDEDGPPSVAKFPRPPRACARKGEQRKFICFGRILRLLDRHSARLGERFSLRNRYRPRAGASAAWFVVYAVEHAVGVPLLSVH